MPFHIFFDATSCLLRKKHFKLLCVVYFIHRKNNLENKIKMLKGRFLNCVKQYKEVFNTHIETVLCDNPCFVVYFRLSLQTDCSNSPADKREDPTGEKYR